MNGRHSKPMLGTGGAVAPAGRDRGRCRLPAPPALFSRLQPHRLAPLRLAPLALALFAFALLSSAAGFDRAAAGEQSSQVSSASPPKPSSGAVSLAGIRLADLDGNIVDMESYLGRGPIVLDFWATWCKPCLAAIPELNQLHADLAPRGLQLIGINEDGQRNAAKVKPFVETQDIRFPVLLDLDRQAQNRLNVAVLPTTLLLDSKGNVVHTTFGYRRGEIDELRRKIEPLLPPARPE